MNPIVQLILQMAPEILAEVQRRHAAANPGAPPPTAEEISAAFESAVTTTLLKDELIKAAHA